MSPAAHAASLAVPAERQARVQITADHQAVLGLAE